MTNEEKRALLDKTVQSLGEHFDAVEILASEHHGDQNQTTTFRSGVGNWFARHGLRNESIIRDRQITKHEVEKEYESEDDQ